jgi:hypothetical protein
VLMRNYAAIVGKKHLSLEKEAVTPENITFL